VWIGRQVRLLCP